MPYIFVDNRDPDAAEGTENYVYYEKGNWESLSRAISEAKRNLQQNRKALSGSQDYTSRTFPSPGQPASNRRWKLPKFWTV